MAATFEARFDSKQVNDLLRQLTVKTKQIKNRDRKVIGILSAIVFRDVMDHFIKEQGPNGKWPAWSKSYRKHMMSIGKGNNKILQDTGRLRNSFKPTNVRKSGDALVWFNNAKTNTGVPYASIHNYGGSKHPPRTFMWLSNRAIQDIETQIIKFLES